MKNIEEQEKKYMYGYRTIQCLKKNVHKRTNITYADGSNDFKEQPNKKTNIQ